MPNTCCSRQPSSGPILLATASPAWRRPLAASRGSSWSARSGIASAACSQSETAGGTSEVRLTRWRAISGKQLMGLGSGPAPRCRPPRTPLRAPGSSGEVVRAPAGRTDSGYGAPGRRFHCCGARCTGSRRGCGDELGGAGAATGELEEATSFAGVGAMSPAPSSPSQNQRVSPSASCVAIQQHQFGADGCQQLALATLALQTAGGPASR